MKRLVLGVVAVAAAALALLLLHGMQGALDRPLALALLLGLAILAGSRPVRFGARGHELTATHPIVLCALAGLGPLPAVLAAGCGAVASLAARRRPVRCFNLAFNLGNVVLSTVAAGLAFGALAGNARDAPGRLLVALLAATAAYFTVNTGLVALVIALDRGGSFRGTWARSFRWTTASYLTALPVAFAMLVGWERIGLAGIALGLPPIWMITGFYRDHRRRIEEQERRISEVERLNRDLERNVGELQRALDHVQRLQGLLPICMHCKNVRDEADTWRRIEAYIAEHSELRFTHSLCQECRDKHYPDLQVDRPARR